jgi:hypothetical protein
MAGLQGVVHAIVSGSLKRMIQPIGAILGTEELLVILPR